MSEVVPHTDKVGALRYKLVLGKFRVIRVNKIGAVLQMHVDLPGLGTMHISVPSTADVREGDLLTFYTEVLSANVGQSSI